MIKPYQMEDTLTLQIGTQIVSEKCGSNQIFFSLWNYAYKP